MTAGGKPLPGLAIRLLGHRSDVMAVGPANGHGSNVVTGPAPGVAAAAERGRGVSIIEQQEPGLGPGGQAGLQAHLHQKYPRRLNSSNRPAPMASSTQSTMK